MQFCHCLIVLCTKAWCRRFLCRVVIWCLIHTPTNIGLIHYSYHIFYLEHTNQNIIIVKMCIIYILTYVALTSNIRRSDSWVGSSWRLCQHDRTLERVAKNVTCSKQHWKAMLGDKPSPCFKPFLIGNIWDKCLPTWILP